MMRVKKLLLALSMLLGMTTTSYAEWDEDQSSGGESWIRALSLAFELEVDLQEFLNSLEGGNGGGYRQTDPGYHFESDDPVLHLAQNISVLQRRSRELAQRAVELRSFSFFRAKVGKRGACLIAGKAKLQAEGGLVLSRTDVTLTRPLEFEERFLSITQKLARFRQLLGCFIESREVHDPYEPASLSGAGEA